MIKYRKGLKYQLIEDCNTLLTFSPPYEIVTEYIQFRPTGELIIKEGYAWDGPSGPTFDTKDFMHGSLVHDALYQLMRQGLLPQGCRIDADKELQRICRMDGMSWLRAQYVYFAVRHFAASCAIVQTEDIQEAA